MKRQALTLLELCIVLLLISVGIGLLPKALPVFLKSRAVEQEMEAVRQFLQLAEGVAQMSGNSVYVDWYRDGEHLSFTAEGQDFHRQRICYKGLSVVGPSSIVFPLQHNQELTLQAGTQSKRLFLGEAPGWIQWVK